MEIDLEATGGDLGSEAPALRTGVCIVGGGIAGLLLADKLSRYALDVLLVEAGGPREGAPAGDSPSGRVNGLRADEAGVSALGGTSLTWGGQLLPLLESEGWPGGAAALSPYLPEIGASLGVDTLPFEGTEFFAAFGGSQPDLAKEWPLLVPRMSKFVPFAKRNLGASLGRALLAHPRVNVALHGRAVELRLTAAGDRVDAVLLRTRSGATRRLEARVVVLAAGTVETCRLLLASRSKSVGGVGNEHGQVGRNFHDHLTVEAAVFEGEARREAIRRFRPWVVGGLKGTVHSLKLEAGERMRRECGVPYAMAHITFEEPQERGLGAVRGWLRARQSGRWPTGAQWAALPRGVGDVFALYRSVRSEQRRYISPQARVGLRLNVAQGTPTVSRIRLAPELDGTGQLQARVARQVSLADLRGLRAFARLLQERFAQLGLTEAGGARWHPALLGADEEWVEGIEDARHAMGGACMGSDPRTSVVDGDLRVHGIENLYVASAAVFPDGRAQLPTMTLMALSLRLGERLRGLLER